MVLQRREGRVTIDAFDDTELPDLRQVNGQRSHQPPTKVLKQCAHPHIVRIHGESKPLPRHPSTWLSAWQDVDYQTVGCAQVRSMAAQLTSLIVKA